MYSQKRNCPRLSPNFHIHVSVSDLYIPTFGSPIILEQNRQTDQGKSLTGTGMQELGLKPRSSFSGNIFFEISVLCLCSVLFRYW